MKILDALLRRFRSTRDDRDLERADRRAFMFGMVATASGLLVPRKTIILPPAELDEWRWYLDRYFGADVSLGGGVSLVGWAIYENSDVIAKGTWRLGP